MGAMRITQRMIADRTLNNLNAQLRSIFRLQDQLATGQRVNRPSDDPIDARAAIDIRAQIRQTEQFIANIADAGPRLQESGTTLLGVNNIIQRARELTLQAANETVGQPQLDQIALEIDQLLEGLLVEGNKRVDNRFIFSGENTFTEAFAATRVGGEITAVTYQGDDESIEVAISEGVRVATNVPGSVAFQQSVDLFQLLIGIRDDMRAGDQASLRNVRVAELDTGQEQVLLSVARVGSIQNRLERSTNEKEELVIELQRLLSDRVDADFAETILDLNVEQNAFQAALNAGARVIQPSLLQFIQ